MGNAASEPRDSTEPFLLNENLVTQVYEGDEDSSETAAWLSEILNEKRPIYEDNKMIVYKIPEPNSSEPFLLLGSGWHEFNECTEREEKIRHDCNGI